MKERGIEKWNISVNPDVIKNFLKYLLEDFPIFHF